MHLSRLKLRDFRNYARLDAEFGPGCHVLLGNNAQGKTNIQSPWLGITGFLVLAIMLSLLIFIGEAVRDAFDPRKAWK
jgi:microcin C transport system permease protein